MIEQTVARILVGVDGSLTIEMKPGGLRALNGSAAQRHGHEGRSLLEPGIVSPGGRRWRVITAAEKKKAVVLVARWRNSRGRRVHHHERPNVNRVFAAFGSFISASLTEVH
jgi:hypothetical protein